MMQFIDFLCASRRFLGFFAFEIVNEDLCIDYLPKA